jgi:hypothetical protein
VAPVPFLLSGAKHYGSLAASAVVLLVVGADLDQLHHCDAPQRAIHTLSLRLCLDGAKTTVFDT